MSAKKYRVRLSPEEQVELKALASKGRTAAYRQTHARIILACDEAQEDGASTDEEIASVLKVGVSTVTRVRRRCVEEGLEAALGRKKQSRRRQRRASTVRRKRIWWPSPAANRRRARRSGRSSCWPNAWWSARSLRASGWRRFGGR